MTAATTATARRLSSRLETLWDFDYEPTHHELESLYETAEKNQWNASADIDWSRRGGHDGPVLNVEKAFAGTRFFTRLTAEEQHEIEVKVSAGRLSQFLHGEQGALLVCGQLVNSIPELDAKLYASTQVVDEGRHAAPQVPRRRDPVAGDPTLAQVLDYVLTDEGRHVNFGYFALRRAIPEMEPGRRQQLEDFALRACDAMYARDDETGFRSIRTVWTEMGWDGEKIWHDTVTNSESPRTFNRPLFTEVLIPRLRRLNVISPRVERRYREIGLLGSGLSP